MIYKKVEIKVEGYQETADLYTYILDNSVEMRPDRKRPVIVICPGGGYTMTSDREAEPIAMQYLARGYHAVILRYSVAPARYPLALLQLAKSVAYLREHAEEFHIDTAQTERPVANLSGMDPVPQWKRHDEILPKPPISI